MYGFPAKYTRSGYIYTCLCDGIELLHKRQDNVHHNGHQLEHYILQLITQHHKQTDSTKTSGCHPFLPEYQVSLFVHHKCM